MRDSTREVLDLIFEFLLSLFILAGSGFLIFKGIASELSSGVITLVVGYWFQKRSNESAVNNLLRQSPTLIPIENSNITPNGMLNNLVDSCNSPTTTPPPTDKNL